MQYNDGGVIHLGDKVSFEPDFRGAVVCSPDTREFSLDFTEEDYGTYIGILVLTGQAGLIHRIQRYRIGPPLYMNARGGRCWIL